MKNTVLILLSGLLVSLANAQDFSAEAIAKVSAFDEMIGHWEGKGFMILPDGTRSYSNVTEDIQYEVGNTVIQTRGVGTKELESGETITVHDALGILYYDVFQKKYKMNSFISKGVQTIADMERNDDGTISWWFSAGPEVTIKYTITLSGDSWKEIGERSTGSDWVKFFEMNLTRQ